MAERSIAIAVAEVPPRRLTGTGRTCSHLSAGSNPVGTTTGPSHVAFGSSSYVQNAIAARLHRIGVQLACQIGFPDAELGERFADVCKRSWHVLLLNQGLQLQERPIELGHPDEGGDHLPAWASKA